MDAGELLGTVNRIRILTMRSLLYRVMTIPDIELHYLNLKVAVEHTLDKSRVHWSERADNISNSHLILIYAQIHRNNNTTRAKRRARLSRLWTQCFLCPPASFKRFEPVYSMEWPQPVISQSPRTKARLYTAFTTLFVAGCGSHIHG